MRYKYAAAVLLGCAVWSAAASAASVSATNGTVSINGRKPVAGPAQVKVGDTVATGQTATATVTYDNGCAMMVEPNQTVSVLTDENCALAMAATTGNTGLLAAGVGAGAIGLAIAVNNRRSASP